MTELRITFLGTGTSVGVPMIGCDCEVCQSDDPRDKRLRASVLIKYGGCNLVIDTGPDFRTQCLRAGLKRLDAVIYTHAHTDHVMGFDDLRRFCAGPPGKIRIYGSAETLTDLERIYHFAFNGTAQFPGYTRPDPRVITGEFECCGLSVTPFNLPHGNCITLGLIFRTPDGRRFCYFSDCKEVTSQARTAARGCELIALDAVRIEPHPTHMHLAQALSVAEDIGAKLTVLTHLCHDIGHARVEAGLPRGVALAYDGLDVIL